MKNINLHMQDAQQNPNKIHAKNSIPTHVMVKILIAQNRENCESKKRKMTLCMGKYQYINS